MTLMDDMHKFGHEQVLFSYDAVTGCRAIIAIHDTTLGPALGGCRVIDYADQSKALKDALLLSRGMTYKAAVAGLPLGGGKAVVMGDVNRLRSRAFFHAFGRFVNSFAGRYITSVDMNTRYEDLRWMSEVSPYVSGLVYSAEQGGVSYATAVGVYYGLKAALKDRLSCDSFAGLRVAVQGVGSVGASLCEFLHEDGAQLVVADINNERLETMVKKYGASVVDTDAIHAHDVDVYAPCARGGILNDQTIPEMKAKIVGGAANNQLEDPDRHGALLAERGILYAPDYVINAGGLMHASYGLDGASHSDLMVKVKGIEATLDDIFSQSKKEGVLPHLISYAIGKKHILEAKKHTQPFSQAYKPPFKK
ncbi:MAG: hypothetical protein OXC44_03845 [Proteobacteria bacterium]|nr:hypothetical protein [Pseudomonadota bacterium]